MREGEWEPERKRRDPFATEFDLSRTSRARGRLLPIGINIYEKLPERANENRWAPLNLTKNRARAVGRDRAIAQARNNVVLHNGNTE